MFRVQVVYQKPREGPRKSTGIPAGSKINQIRSNFFSGKNYCKYIDIDYSLYYVTKIYLGENLNVDKIKFKETALLF